MRVDPYVKGPRHGDTVALLKSDGTVVDEHGERAVPGKTVRTYCSYDTVRELVLDGRGEALCWNGEEIRWRESDFQEPGWQPAASDVGVIRLPFPESDEDTLRGFALWRDWLDAAGAGVAATAGGASWKLLRASLVEPLWLGVGERPPLKQTLGGRQQLGPAGPGSFTGELRLYDLPAAYAHELANLRYGGRWLFDRYGDPAWWASDGKAVFVHAKVRIPREILGPLPRRPRKPTKGLSSVLLGAWYPVGTRLQGVWTYEELQAALEAGCRVEKHLGTFVHLSGDRYPFASWWQRILEGRSLGGFAGWLAKLTGNALWGQFCMDARSAGERTIMRRRGAKMVSVRVPFKGGGRRIMRSRRRSRGGCGRSSIERWWRRETGSCRRTRMGSGCRAKESLLQRRLRWHARVSALGAVCAGLLRWIAGG